MRFLLKIFLPMMVLVAALISPCPTATEKNKKEIVRARERAFASLMRSPHSLMMNSEERAAKETEQLEAQHTSSDLAASELDHAAWNQARPVRLERYWSGERAPAGRQAEARLLWSDAALLVRFVGQQTEPLAVNSNPQVGQKMIGLWERDVCELFLAPDIAQVERYFEFEAAPTGEWLDLKIHWKPEERETDWEFHSGMTAAARIRPGTVTIAIRVPWEALGRRPQAGERWRGNLFRCVGTGATRGYLTWRPTHTEQPNFHVPSAFGWIRFVKT